MYPSEQNDPMYLRELDKIIVWSTNSEDVTFTIPGMSLKVDVRDHQWPM
ncbi:MAG TPA: hypothetical protein VFW05_19495 [Verrucomicrobiae bacterium]|nr:hypothetical protein [Verrucomicrobiae bacterium]